MRGPFLINIYLALQVSVCYFVVITLVLQGIEKYVQKGERKWLIQRKC